MRPISVKTMVSLACVEPVIKKDLALHFPDFYFLEALILVIPKLYVLGQSFCLLWLQEQDVNFQSYRDPSFLLFLLQPTVNRSNATSWSYQQTQSRLLVIGLA